MPLLSFSIAKRPWLVCFTVFCVLSCKAIDSVQLGAMQERFLASSCSWWRFVASSMRYLYSCITLRQNMWVHNLNFTFGGSILPHPLVFPPFGTRGQSVLAFAASRGCLGNTTMVCLPRKTQDERQHHDGGI